MAPNYLARWARCSLARSLGTTIHRARARRNRRLRTRPGAAQREQLDVQHAAGDRGIGFQPRDALPAARDVGALRRPALRHAQRPARNVSVNK